MMTSESYSALKAAWHTRDIEELRVGRNIVPHHVYLIISDLCNQNCSFCSYRSEIGWSSSRFGADTGKGFTMNPNRKIAAEKAFEILDDFAELGVRAVQFTGGGEPTVHPDCEAIFAYALHKGLQVGLVTNGTKQLNAELVKRFSWLRVSIDAGFEATYERTRQSKLWPRVMSNLREYAQLEGPHLGASFVTTRDNYGELLNFCALMKEIGVPYVKISANLTTEGLAYYDGILDAIIEQMEIAKQLANGSFKIVNVFERRLEDLRLGRPEVPFCGQQHFAGYIGGDLKVYRCCNTAYTAHGEIGDLSEQRYRDWLFNEAREQLNEFDARSCTHCQFIEKNEITAYLVQQAPHHVEFI